MISLVWLYPNQLNLYGDRGNIECLQQRLNWRGIKNEVIKFSPGEPLEKISGGDLFFAGGGPDSSQRVVSQDALRIKGLLAEKMEKGISGLFICGFYQLLGKYYRPAEGKDIPGLGIFDLYTQHFGSRKKRCVGNIVVSSATPLTSTNTTLIGFENHEGRTFLGESASPFAKVIKGFGNNGEDRTEGVVLNNFIGTYLHGPLLPKNPHLSDWLLEKAVGKKLSHLDDHLEKEAHKFALDRL